MDSSYFGEANQQERGRKSKKSSNSEKPKQPQRGLGVAQLEKIRLHDLSSSCAYQYPTYNFNNLEDIRVQTAYSSIPSSSSSSSASYGLTNNIRMGLVHEYDKTNNIRLYGDSQPTAPPRWDISGEALILENQHNFDQPSMTSSQYPLNLHDSEHMQMVRGIDHGSNSLMGHSHRSPNSELSDDQEVDLELRLSL